MLGGLSEGERALAEAALAQGVLGEGELRVALASGGDFGGALRAAAGARAWQLDVIEQELTSRAPGVGQVSTPAPLLARLRWEPGEVVEGYTLLRLLGSGGMGEVFLAEDAGGARHALKRLGREADAGLRARFQREGEAQARVDGHPNVLRVRRSVQVGAEAFLVLDVASGGDLSDRIDEEPLPVDEVFELGIALAEAIEHAHGQGVLHRDLKPSNVLFDEAGVPKICDFGLAALEGADTLTKTGATLGTPSYMAPEQADPSRGEIGEWTDVYALGALLFAAVTGRPPFEGEGRMALVSALLLKEAPRARSLRSEVPLALDAVLEICLRKEPEGRFSNARDLRLALLDAREGVVPDRRNPGRRRRRSRLLLGALALVTSLGAAIGAATFALDVVGAPSATPQEEVRIELEKAPTLSYRSWVVLRGKVRGDGAVKLRVGDARPLRLDSEGRFSARVALAEGLNELSFEALGREGEVVARLRHELRFTETPSWWRRLSEERRPALPLPKGLSFGEDPETYRYREGSTLVWIPPGSFVMGRPEEGFVRGGVEKFKEGARNVKVTLTRGYFIGKYEVTWGQLSAFNASQGGEPYDRHLNFRIKHTVADLGARQIRGEGVDFWAGDEYPAHGLSWIVADDYTRFYGLRLPTEAEWEYAARGQQVGAYPWGDRAPGPQLLNRFDPTDGFPYTAPVDSFPDGASPFGCLNMAGNVAEFTSSYYAPYPKEAVVDWPGGPRSPDYVVRGWGFMHSQPQLFSVYNRWTAKAIQPQVEFGFRVALSHDPEGG